MVQVRRQRGRVLARNLATWFSEMRLKVAAPERTRENPAEVISFRAVRSARMLRRQKAEGKFFGGTGGEIFGVGLGIGFARQGEHLRAVVGDEFEREAGEGAFEFGFEGGLGDFEAEFLEAGGEDDFAGALERGEFAGEEVGDFFLGDEALGGGEILGKCGDFGEVGAGEGPVGEDGCYRTYTTYRS